MANPGFTKTLTAEGVINPYRIVCHGSKDLTVVQASAATAALMGVTSEFGADAAGERVDVTMGDLPDVQYGGTVQRGDPLTSDAEGKAIKATVSGSRIIGYAYVSAVSNDIAPYQHALGLLP